MVGEPAPQRDAAVGQTFMIAMADPFSYADAAEYVASKLNIGVLQLTDPVGHDFCIDTTKARNVLGYAPQYDIHRLIDQAVEFRQSGKQRRQRSGYQG